MSRTVNEPREYEIDPPCRFGTYTREPWGLGDCVIVECSNTRRISNIRTRTDDAASHTRYPQEYANNREDVTYLRVRSRFCNAEHCVDFENFDD